MLLLNVVSWPNFDSPEPYSATSLADTVYGCCRFAVLHFYVVSLINGFARCRGYMLSGRVDIGVHCLCGLVGDTHQCACSMILTSLYSEEELHTLFLWIKLLYWHGAVSDPTADILLQQGAKPRDPTLCHAWDQAGLVQSIAITHARIGKSVKGAASLLNEHTHRQMNPAAKLAYLCLPA